MHSFINLNGLFFGVDGFTDTLVADERLKTKARFVKRFHRTASTAYKIQPSLLRSFERLNRLFSHSYAIRNWVRTFQRRICRYVGYTRCSSYRIQFWLILGPTVCLSVFTPWHLQLPSSPLGIDPLNIWFRNRWRFRRRQPVHLSIPARRLDVNSD